MKKLRPVPEKGKMLMLFLFFLLGTIQLRAQALTDTIAAKPKIKPYFSIDSRNSFIRDRRANFFGIKAGITDGRMHWGLGFYLMSKPLTLDFIVQPDGLPPDTVQGKFRFWYATYFLEPVWMAKKRWEISSPVNLGIGRSGFTFPEGTLGELPRRHHSVGVIEPYFTFQYKVLPWIGLGTGAGYRFIISPYEQVRQSLNAPIYFIKVKVFTGVIIKAILKKKE